MPVPRRRKRIQNLLMLLPQGWQEVLTEIYAKGGTDTEVLAEVTAMCRCYTPHLWQQLLDEIAGFTELVQRGQVLSQAWWEKEGRTHVSGKNFNTTVWVFTMKNRFGAQWNEEPTSIIEAPAPFIIERTVHEADQETNPGV